MQQHVLVAGTQYKGQGPQTAATLTAAAVAAVVAGSLPRAAVLAYWLANTANQTGTGYLKGSQGYYNYLAWYAAACGGNIHTQQAQAAGRAAYTNPKGSLCNPNSTNPARLSQHAVWALGQTLKNYAAAQQQTAAAAQAAKASA